MPTTDNAEQGEFWSGPAGQKWITHQEGLDAILGAATGPLLEIAAIAPGEKVLEIGCGTGANSLALARATGPTGDVMGLDISAPLLALANTRRDEAGADHLRFTHGDAQIATLEPGHYDVAVSRFGVMFFADSVTAFRNIRAALRPGGRIIFACWAKLALNPWFGLPRAAAVARLGEPEAPPPFAPGPMAFAEIARVAGLLKEAGFSACEGEERALDLHHPGGPGAAATLAVNVGIASRMLRDKGGSREDHDAIQRETEAAFAPFATTDGVRVPARLNFFTARNG